MKKTFLSTGAALLAAASLLFLAGCKNAASPPHPPTNDATTGTLSLTIGRQGLIRTILPDVELGDFAQFRLDFAPADDLHPNLPFNVVWTGGSGIVPLEVGNWYLRVTAFLETVAGLADLSPAEAFEEAAAVGRIWNIAVEPGAPVERLVTIRPISYDDDEFDGGQGTFAWDVTFPDPSIIGSAQMAIRWNDSPIETVDLENHGAGALDLDAGWYEVVIALVHTEGEAVTIPQDMRIYQNMISVLRMEFSEIHFPVTLLTYILRSWNAGSGTWDFADRGIDHRHFNAVLIDGENILGVTEDNFDDLTDRFDRLSVEFGAPTTGAGLIYLVDAALVAIGLDDLEPAEFEELQDIVDALEGFVTNSSPMTAGYETDAAAGEATVFAEIGTYRMERTFPLIGGSVSIFGTMVDGYHRVGDTLTADTGLVVGAGDFIFRWMRGGLGETVPPSADEIAGEIDNEIGGDSNVYVPAPGDAYHFIIVEVRLVGYFGRIRSEAVGPIRHPQEDGTFEIELERFGEIGYEVQGPSVSYLDLPGEAPVIAVTYRPGLDVPNIRWLVNGAEIAAGDGSLTFTMDWSWDATGEPGSIIGTHLVTVRAPINGVPYSRLVSITVTP